MGVHIQLYQGLPSSLGGREREAIGRGWSGAKPGSAQWMCATFSYGSLRFLSLIFILELYFFLKKMIKEIAVFSFFYQLFPFLFLDYVAGPISQLK